MKNARIAFGVALLGAMLAVTTSCASDPDDGSAPRLPVADLDPNAYAAFVQPVMERHCGSLDCHGKLPRGLRVYGQNSLRLSNDGGLSVGIGKTTPDEARATYVSIIGLQPELTNDFASKSPRTTQDAYGLLLLAKPLAIERHRPGPSLRKGEPAERCITSWLIGGAAGIDKGACAAGAPPLAP